MGVEPAPPEAIPAGSPDDNARTARRVLAGEAGAERSLAVLNAGAAIYVGGAVPSVDAGCRRAEQAIDSGAAADLLDRFVAETRRP